MGARADAQEPAGVVPAHARHAVAGPRREARATCAVANPPAPRLPCSWDHAVEAEKTSCEPRPLSGRCRPITVNASSVAVPSLRARAAAQRSASVSRGSSPRPAPRWIPGVRIRLDGGELGGRRAPGRQHAHHARGLLTHGPSSKRGASGSQPDEAAPASPAGHGLEVRQVERSVAARQGTPSAWPGSTTRRHAQPIPRPPDRGATEHEPARRRGGVATPLAGADLFSRSRAHPSTRRPSTATSIAHASSMSQHRSDAGSSRIKRLDAGLCRRSGAGRRAAAAPGSSPQPGRRERPRRSTRLRARRRRSSPWIDAARRGRRPSRSRDTARTAAGRGSERRRPSRTVAAGRLPGRRGDRQRLPRRFGGSVSVKLEFPSTTTAHGRAPRLAAFGVNVLEEHERFPLPLAHHGRTGEGREACCRRLLELDSFLRDEQIATYAVDEAEDSVYLRALGRLSGFDFEEFEDLLHTMATVATSGTTASRSSSPTSERLGTRAPR